MDSPTEEVDPRLPVFSEYASWWVTFSQGGGGLHIWKGWGFWIKPLKENDLGVAQVFIDP